ncbi:hypothetical protein LTS18_012729, partial [Coniosporium uncinatum]
MAITQETRRSNAGFHLCRWRKMQKMIANGTCVSRMRSHWKTSHHGSSMAGPALPEYLCQRLVLCRFHKSLLKGSRLYHEVEKEA